MVHVLTDEIEMERSSVERVPAIDVEDLRYSYPDGTPGLRGVSFQVEAGERVALLGPNGAGKSTLLLNLNGILRAQSGTVRIDGVTLSPATERAIRSRIGLLFSNPDDQLFSPTVLEDVAYGPLHMGLERDEVLRRSREALAAVGMADFEDRMPHRLSLGQKKRIAVATVLSMGTPILALDEPTASLAPMARRDLINLLSALPQTIVVATHDLAMVADMLPRTIIIDEGQVVTDRPTVEVLNDAELLLAHGLEPLSAHGHPHA